MKDIEFTTHLGCDVTLFDPNENWVSSLGPGKMLSLRMLDGRYVEVHLSPEDLAALFGPARGEALEEAAAALDKAFYTSQDEIPFTIPRANEPAHQTGHFLQTHSKNMIQRWLRARS